ncbi:MAG: 2-oxo acid dehydrogenase subunit E2 [Candidatus Lambdaproteobacteria bacterium]|nr:2-oxo acid dehydrogenase subunit E2 [Candidatus Lambdaproteobacteria bacterium]
MYEFRMPSLGADMEAGTLVEWLIKPGDAVKRGDVVAVVDTDKAMIDMEIWQSGVLRQIVVQAGERVPVGAVLALLQVEGVPAAEPATAAPAAVPTVAAAPASAAPQPAAAYAPGRTQALPGREHVTPWARKLARELGIDLAGVHGTGVGGAITHQDVERAAARPGVAPTVSKGRLRASPRARRLAQELGVALEGVAGSGPEGAVVAADVERAARQARETAAPAATEAEAVAPETRAALMRRAIAAAMTRSKREIPHYYLATEIDMGAALDWLQSENERRPVPERLLYSALLIKAVARAAAKVPEVNGFWTDVGFRPSAAVNLGMAVSLRQGGLIAPALMDVQDKSLGEIMRALRDLVARARAGRMRSSELSDATLTLTNLGEQGVDVVYGIIYPPQVALVGFGRISARRTITATLAADHRVSDGHRGAVYLNAIDRLLQQPAAL